jgi:subtilase family serine protease
MRESHSALSFLNKLLFGGLFIGLTAINLIAAQPAQRIRGEISDYSRFALTGNVHAALAQAKDQGTAAGTTALPNLAIHFSMSPSQNADLLQLLRLQQTRHSTQFHKWLTPEEYAERFGLNEKDIAKVTAWLETMGFSNVKAARTRSFVTFDGTAAQAETAFHTSIHRYILNNGESHIANASEPQLPNALKGMVVGIRGLNDFHPKPRAHPHFTSSISGDHFLTPDDFAAIYDIQTLYGKGITGAGRSIVIPGQTDIMMSDIEAFQTAAGLPVKDPQVILTGPDPGTLITSGDLGETDLDLEWSGGIAKGAGLVYVEATDVFTAVAYAIDNNLADVLPITYGECESEWGPAEIASANAMFQTANVQGMTVLAAAGDDGAADCDGGTDPNTVVSVATQGLAVDFPASSPYVTGVGGTTFSEGTGSYWNTTNDSYGGSAISYIPEVAWNDTSTANGLEASGGGASNSFAKPSWQVDTGVPADNARDVPDVALAASPNHDGFLSCSNGSCVTGFRDANQDLNVTGGTSAGSPSFGAIVALLDQEEGGRQGNINQNLYLLASISSNSFHDITSGTNIVPCKGGTPACSSTVPTVNGTLGYTAGIGYDQVTGLGSVDANLMFEEWTGDFSLTSSPTSLNVTAGTSGSSTITVSPYKNFSGNVTFTCSVAGALANVTCSIPGTVSAASGATTLTVTASSSAAAPWWRRTPQLYLLAGLLLALSAYLLTGQRKLQPFAVAFAVLLVVGLASCGGGSSSSTTGVISGGVSETGEVTVVGSSGSLSNSITIAVTVQ